MLLCLLMRLGVEGFAYSAARAFAPQRWAGATEALPRVLLPRGGGRAGSVVSAASDDTTPLEEQLSRTKAMLDAEDYAGAADESAAALEVLPDLAEAARLRGRALLDPLLDQMLADRAAEVPQAPRAARRDEAADLHRLLRGVGHDDLADALVPLLPILDEPLQLGAELCRPLLMRFCSEPVAGTNNPFQYLGAAKS